MTLDSPLCGSAWLDSDGRVLRVDAVVPGDSLGREVRGVAGELGSYPEGGQIFVGAYLIALGRGGLRASTPSG